MKIMVVETTTGRLDVVVDEDKVVAMASVLEASKTVKTYHIDGFNVPNQQGLYGCAGFDRWINPIHQ